jgi:4-hydroxy-tetrahydrodipicolinate synthase
MTAVPLPRPKLKGIIPPLVTPLHSGGKLDTEGLQRMVDRVIAGGVHGLFLLGSTGEAPSLSVKTRRELIRAAIRAVAGRAPLLVNVSDTAFAHSLELAQESAYAGASAVVLSPPSYYPIDQQQLFSYTRDFCSTSPLPVFLYNVPQYTKNAFAPETVAELSHLRNVIGIKNSDGSLQYLASVLEHVSHRSDFAVLAGNEEMLLPALRAGADGGVCGGANMFPHPFTKLYDAEAAGDATGAEEMQDIILRLSEATYRVGAAETSYLRGLKQALSFLGLIQPNLAEPLQSFTSQEQSDLQHRLKTLLQDVPDLSTDLVGI